MLEDILRTSIDPNAIRAFTQRQMSESFQPKTAGDVEAVTLAESYDLLSSVVGPYMYQVSGAPGEQQAIFASAEIQALFYIRVHEFLAEAPVRSSPTSVPHALSLFSGGGWIAQRHPTRAKRTGLEDAYNRADQWFSRVHRIVFWAPSISRHLRLELPMKTLIAMRANLEKHQLLRLEQEIQRLHSKCIQSGCHLSVIEAVAVREEFESHVRGMLEYHATQVAELIARYFLALYRFIRELYLEHPTNNLDQISAPPDISDDVFRYMYAATIVGFARWTESRIESSIPTTAPAFKQSYPQHETWSVIDTEQNER
jgi:hypothetical protein